MIERITTRLQELTDNDWEHVAFGLGVLLGGGLCALAIYITIH